MCLLALAAVGASRGAGPRECVCSFETEVPGASSRCRRLEPAPLVESCVTAQSPCTVCECIPFQGMRPTALGRNRYRSHPFFDRKNGGRGRGRYEALTPLVAGIVHESIRKKCGLFVLRHSSGLALSATVHAGIFGLKTCTTALPLVDTGFAQLFLACKLRQFLVLRRNPCDGFLTGGPRKDGVDYCSSKHWNEA